MHELNLPPSSKRLEVYCMWRCQVQSGNMPGTIDINKNELFHVSGVFTRQEHLGPQIARHGRHTKFRLGDRV